jgi:hypothetical protein
LPVTASIPQRLRRTDDDGLQGQHGLAARLDRAVAGHLELADHLDPAGARLRHGGGLPGEHGAGGAFGVEVVGLAVLAAQPAVRTADLVDHMAAPAEEARQAGAVGARALDAEGAGLPQRTGPGGEPAVAFGADRKAQLAQARAERRDSHGGVDVLVGVDADQDVGRDDLAHVTCSPNRLGGFGDRASGQDCDGRDGPQAPMKSRPARPPSVVRRADTSKP